jgi:hypothetical protein
MLSWLQLVVRRRAYGSSSPQMMTTLSSLGLHYCILVQARRAACLDLTPVERSGPVFSFSAVVVGHREPLNLGHVGHSIFLSFRLLFRLSLVLSLRSHGYSVGASVLWRGKVYVRRGVC